MYRGTCRSRRKHSLRCPGDRRGNDNQHTEVLNAFYESRKSSGCQSICELASKAAAWSVSDLAAKQAYYKISDDRLASRMKAMFSVDIVPSRINGVGVEVVTPKDGISAKNKNRILINLHGGSFLWGEGSGGEAESIPIASLGKIKVMTVAYRQGPESRFPAASEDVASVYRDLLKRYKPQNIGIYGCSAGGILTAESVAWFAKVGLPRPGAIGTFCGSVGELAGDSSYLGPALLGATPPSSPFLLLSLPILHRSRFS